MADFPPFFRFVEFDSVLKLVWRGSVVKVSPYQSAALRDGSGGGIGKGGCNDGAAAAASVPASAVIILPPTVHVIYCFPLPGNGIVQAPIRGTVAAGDGEVHSAARIILRGR